MATFVAGSVSVLVKPVMKGFHDDLKKQLSGTGLESVGRDIADDVTKPLKDEAKKAGDPLKKELPKDAKKAGKEASEQIRKQMKNPLKRAKIGIGNTFKKLGKKAGTHFKQNFGRMIKGGLLFAGTALAGGTLWFGKEAIQEASNLEQSVGAIDSVFGDLSSTMHQFSEEAAQTLGLSKNEYNELATLMGTQLKVGGLDGTELTSGVQDLMGLSADLSSMFGGTTAEANTAISALLRGETEPIRRYGVSIDQAAVKNKALEMGLISQGEEMDAAARQQATLALLYEQTGDAQGNFARESDTLANKQQRASAAFDNLKASVGEMLLPAMTALFEYVIETVLPAIEDLVGWVKDDLIPAFKEFGDWIQNNRSWLEPLALIIGGIAVALGLVSGALSLVTLATTAWGIAMSLTPLGWIVIAIGAVVGALVWFFTQTEIGAELWDKIWGGIKTAAGAVWNWIKDTLWPGIVAAWDAIAAGAIWLYENAIKPAWDWIKQAIGVVVDWIVGTVWPALQTAWQYISDAAMWLWGIFKTVWDGIMIAVAVVITAVLLYIDLLKWYFTNVIAPVAMWLWNNVMKPVWNGIKAAIGAVVTWFKDVAWPLLSSVIDWIKTKFEQFKIGLVIIWNFIMNNVIKPVITWFQTVVWPIISLVIDWIKNKFEMFKIGLGIIWNFIKNNIINPVINWFQNTAWPLISSVIDSIKRGFNIMKDGIKAAWDFVKNKAINPIVSWFENTVKPKIETVAEAVTSAFETMKDNIGKAWEKVKSLVAVPIDFVVNTVINEGIVGTFNKVAEKLGIDTRLPTVKFDADSALASSGGGGGGMKRTAMKTGGVLPGYTPGRDVHQFYSPTGGLLELSGGEAIMRPEWTRAVGGPAAVAAMNAKARKGQAFKDGGVWEWVKGAAGDTWDFMKDAAKKATEFLSDPIGMFGKVADGIFSEAGFSGSGMMFESAKQIPKNIIKGIKESFDKSEAAAGGPVGPMPAGASRSLSYARQLASAYGLTMTSHWRRGARTAGSGSRSLHSMGRAMDFSNSSGPTKQMMAFFNAMHPLKPTELLYSPAGGRQWRRWGVQQDTSGVTKRGHYNHVHVGFKDGGVMPELHDKGGVLQPGLSVISNQTRKPEAILTDSQWKTAEEAMARQSRGGITQNLYIRDTSATVGQIASELDWGMRSAQIRGRV